MLKTEIDETTTQTESTQEQAELSEHELNEVAGGLNYTRTAPKPAQVD